MLCIVVFLGGTHLFAITTLDGAGGSLALSSTSTLEIAAGKRILVKNLILRNLSGERLVMGSAQSKLILDNVRLVLDDHYSLSQGSVEIRNNCSIEGAYTFTLGAHDVFITKGAQLKVGPRATLDYCPTGSGRNAIRFEDRSSELLFAQSTFKNSNIHHGPILRVGTVLVDGTVFFDHSLATTLHGTTLGGGPDVFGDGFLRFMPESTLHVLRGGLVVDNTCGDHIEMIYGHGSIKIGSASALSVESGITLSKGLDLEFAQGAQFFGLLSFGDSEHAARLDITRIPAAIGEGEISSISSSNEVFQIELGGVLDTDAAHFAPNGKYIAAEAAGGGTTELRVYELDASATSTLSQKASVDVGASIFAIRWSPDGRHIAIGKDSGAQRFQIYRFDELAGTLTEVGGAESSEVTVVDWSPDGRLVAVRVNDGGNSFTLYSFDERASSPLTQVATVSFSGGSTPAPVWHPSGRYIAAASNAAASGTEIRVFTFDEESLSASELKTGVEIEGQPGVLIWSPDGRYLANGQTFNTQLRIYRFDPEADTILTLVVDEDTGQALDDLAWSPDGRYLAYGAAGPSGSSEFALYRFNGSSVSLLGGIDFSESAKAVTFSPDGRFIFVGLNDGTGEEIRLYKPTRQALIPKVTSLRGVIALDGDLDISALNITV